MENNYAVKSLGNNRLGGYGVLWGNESVADVQGEFFTPTTAELLSIYQALGMLPGIYDHGMNKSLKSRVTGVIDVMKMDTRGIWVEEQLRISDSYLEDILYLVDQGRLFWSSGALPAAYQVTKNGQITRWPIMEMSKTTSPADWRMVFTPITQVRKHFDLIGIDLPSALKSSGLIPEESHEGDEESHEESGISNINLLRYQLDYEYLLLDMEDV